MDDIEKVLKLCLLSDTLIYLGVTKYTGWFGNPYEIKGMTIYHKLWAYVEEMYERA